MSLFTFFSVLLISNSASALETSYLNFLEPPGWKCQQNQSVWLCRSDNPLIAKESFIVVKAKLVGRSDNLKNFYNSLKTPLPLPNATGANALSKVYEVKTTNINNHPWVKGVHLSSVTENYFTEYFVTVAGDLAIGLELHYHQSRYQHYQPISKSIASSLTIIDNIATQKPQPALRIESQKVAQQMPSTKDLTMAQQSPMKNKKQLYIFIGLGLAVIVISSFVAKHM